MLKKPTKIPCSKTPYFQGFRNREITVQITSENQTIPNMKKYALYQRVSTVDQSTSSQRDVLIRFAEEKIKLLLVRQGHMLELMSINELSNRRKRIEELQIKARFSIAESYDRAVKKQQNFELEKAKAKALLIQEAAEAEEIYQRNLKKQQETQQEQEKIKKGKEKSKAEENQNKEKQDKGNK